MGAYHNALREEGTRDDLMEALEKAWTEIEELRAQRENQAARMSMMTSVDPGALQFVIGYLQDNPSPFVQKVIKILKGET
jgi:hypothetical protein